MRSALERTPSIRSAQSPLRLLWSPMARGAVTVQQCDDRPRMAPLADVDASLSPAHRMRPAASRPSLRHAQPSLRALRRCTRRDATRRSCSLNQGPPLFVGLGNPIFSLPGISCALSDPVVLNRRSESVSARRASPGGVLRDFLRERADLR